MSKAAARGQQWNSRSASFSTRAAPTGVNLLGWDSAAEQMTPEQERDALKANLLRLQEIRRHAKTGAIRQSRAEFDRLGKAIAEINARMNSIRPSRSSAPGIDRYIIEVLRARLSVGEWRAVIDQANAMQREQEAVQHSSCDLGTTTTSKETE